MSGGASIAEIRDRLSRVREHIARAGGHDVEIVAVTKGFGADLVQRAVSAGCQRIGESYAQEWVAKSSQLGNPRPTVHFIGRLQTNKVRALAGIVDVVESVDRASLIDELARRLPSVTVLVQVNATNEDGKGGCRPSETESLVEHARHAGLHVDGLMTVGPTEGGPEAARRPFAEVRALCDRLSLPTCSMGMSDDYEIAVAEGSTRVRVGSVLFGARPLRV